MADEPPAAGATPSQQPDPTASTTGGASAPEAVPVAAPTPAPDTAVTPGEAAGLQVPAPATPAAAVDPNATLAAAIGTGDAAMPDQAMIDELLKQAEFEDPSGAGRD